MLRIPLQKKSKIPLLGLGTWRLQGKECENVVKQALELGYRHIDTADIYDNHRAIANAIKSIPRNEIYLVSKLYLNNLTSEKVNLSIPRFLEELQTDYLDLLLIHWPHPTIAPKITLKAMLAFKNNGIVKAIGVSNFVRSHFKDLEEFNFPVVTNQIEMHAYLQRKELVRDCIKRGITITAYRPLAKGDFETDPILQKIGKGYGKSSSQIVLRWLTQDIAVIPKAGKTEHLKANLEIFDFTLTDEDIKTIESLDTGKRYCAPDVVPISND